jgi:hypothetical protein
MVGTYPKCSRPVCCCIVLILLMAGELAWLAWIILLMVGTTVSAGYVKERSCHFSYLKSYGRRIGEVRKLILLIVETKISAGYPS